MKRNMGSRTKRDYQGRSWLVILTMGVLALNGLAARESLADVLPLRVVNDTDDPQTRVVTFKIKSEKPHNPRSPWVVYRISRGRQVTINLRSPDRFIYELQVGRTRFTSDPVALKKVLRKNPNAFLSLASLQGGGPEDNPPIMMGAFLGVRDGQLNTEDLSDDEAQGLSQHFPKEPAGGFGGRPLVSFAPGDRPNRVLLGIDCDKCSEGIHINSVNRGGPASRSRDRDGDAIRIEPKDHIVSINGVSIRSFQHYLDLLSESPRTVEFGLKDHRTDRILTLRTELW